MTRRSALDRLHDATIRVQLPLVLATVPVIAALHGMAVVPVAIDLAGPVARGAAAPVGAAVAVVVAGVVLATIAAGLLLRGSLRTTVQQLQVATDAVARGDFRHRVASGRTDELGDLAASIDVMAERLERLEHARRRMLACVSHELRTPLTIIQGYAYTLARHELDVERRARLDLVQSEATRLGGLIEDLVEAASLHAGGVRLRVERCDLGDLVREEVARFRAEARRRGLDLLVTSTSDPIPVDVDPGRVGQVMANLLGNAVRHAEQGGRITVDIESTRGRLRSVTITNPCEPIASEVVEHLFEPFVQGEALAGSVGLGLTIVQALVSAHGGRVWFDERAAASGVARVTFELPCPTPQVAPDRPRHARRAAGFPSLAVER